MRPEPFLRQPFPRAQAHRRHALRTPLRPLQNQLERGPMTGIGARLGVAAEGRSLRRPLRVRAAIQPQRQAQTRLKPSSAG